MRTIGTDPGIHGDYHVIMEVCDLGFSRTCFEKLPLGFCVSGVRVSSLDTAFLHASWVLGTRTSTKLSPMHTATKKDSRVISAVAKEGLFSPNLKHAYTL